MPIPVSDPSCQILPLEPRWQAEAKALYDSSFARAALPYAHRLPELFLANRVFSSCLWPSDCSRMIRTTGGEWVGFALANRRANPAAEEGAWLWLQLVCIAPRWRRQGFGRRILNSLLEQAAQEGREGVATSMQWAGIWPGIPAGLTAMHRFCDRTGASLRPGESYLVRDLRAAWPLTCAARRPIDQEGVKLLACTPSHHASLRVLLQEQFSMGWQHETLSRIDPGYEPFNGYGLATTWEPGQAGRGIWIAEHWGEVVGFCVVQQDAEGACHFGPIGLRLAWRGRGLGTRLLRTAADEVVRAGGDSLGLWTSALLAGGFYAPLGFRPLVTTRHAVWSVER
ncbi:MAG: GNAT family N-acetyltransferase [Magnetococcus sp. MYC-9]